ncbi:MAG: thioredoxin-disulfide reductase [Hespellia sp.]|jgi:thioredoxin reductase (NADPH)|nr:thioredoxin-disulfide reductase [Hespellia sp.]
MYDIGIIGGGTAGLTAAIYAQRAGKQTVILEAMSYGGQITATHKIENYPGIESISGGEFAEGLMSQAKKLGADMKSEKVMKVREERDHKVIETEGNLYECKAVILATGVTHRRLGVQRETQLIGAGVSYCATCDGAFFRGRNVAVIGGGNTALQDVSFLSNYCKKVYLVHRRKEFRGEQHLVELLKEKENVEFVLDATVKELIGEEYIEGVVLNRVGTDETMELQVDGVFVAIGHVPQNDVFEDIVKLDGSGFILAAEDCQTSCPGIFAAGDCRTKEVRQLTTAAADGAVAAIAGCNYLDRMDAR